MGKYFETFVPLLFSFSTGRAPICTVALALALLPACSKLPSEPVYGGLSMEGFNYMPYNLDRFVVHDKYGNTAGGGGDLMPGAGEGRLSCCYRLEGTDFTVDWEVYDADEAQKQILAQQDTSVIRKTTQVHLPPTEVTGEAGDVVLGLHFYPDDHVEFEFRHDLHGSRIDYSEVFGWLWNNYRKQAFPANLDDAQAFRLTARIGADGVEEISPDEREGHEAVRLLHADRESPIRRVSGSSKDPCRDQRQAGRIR